MIHDPPLLQKAVRSAASSTTSMRLQGRKLLIARSVWVASVVLTLVVFIMFLPAYFVQLQTVCTSVVCPTSQPTPTSLSTLQEFGISSNGYAAFSLALILVVMLACLIVSGVIFWRKSDDGMALLVAFVLVIFGTLYVTDVLQESHSAWRLLAIVLNLLGNGVVILVGSLFPSGRFVPSWSRWLVIGWLLWGMVFTILRDLPSAYLLHTLFWLGAMTCVAGGQFYRYRYVSSLVERQQTKWAVFGGIITILVLVTLTFPRLTFSVLGQSGSFYQLTTGPLYPFGALLISLSLAMAILRYRLWDIDVIIKRTLVYGLLTASLALIYFGLIIGTQFLLRGLINQTNNIGLIVSTLAIAALFQPLRRRIQILIDRRFYRRKYDATRTLAAFSVTLRNEVDLNQLSEQLVAVIKETMQPTQVSLWLRKSERERNPNTTA